jgi:hypothetical protein
VHPICQELSRDNQVLVEEPEKLRTDVHGIYATMYLDVPMVYVTLILCLFFGKKNPTHFSVEWVSIMHEVT